MNFWKNRDVDEHPYSTANNCTIIHPTLSCQQVTNVGDTCNALVCLNISTNSTSSSDIIVNVGQVQCPKSLLRTVLSFPNSVPYTSYSSGDNVTCYTSDSSDYFVSYFVYYKTAGAPWKILSGISWGALVGIIGPITIVVIVYWILIYFGVIKSEIFIQSFSSSEQESNRKIETKSLKEQHKRQSNKYVNQSTILERTTTNSFDYEREDEDDGIVIQI